MKIDAIRALRHRNFRLFFCGQSLSLIGTWMTRLATSWLVYRLTGSSLLLGVISFAGQIPTFLLGPVAGVWVDRWVRRRVLLVTQALAAVQSLALAGLTLSGRITITEIVLLSIFQGLINAFDMPARQSFLVHMVEGRADLSNAIALNSTMVNGARLLGPALAGIIIAAFGEGYCFLIDGVSYFAVIASLVAITVQGQTAGAIEGGYVSPSFERVPEAYVAGFAPDSQSFDAVCDCQFHGCALHGVVAGVCHEGLSWRRTYAGISDWRGGCGIDFRRAQPGDS